MHRRLLKSGMHLGYWCWIKTAVLGSIGIFMICRIICTRETANIERMVQAVRVQLDAIEKIRRLRGLEYLSEDLHAMAILREENPDSSLSELAEMSALSRSGVNHRLRRIVDIAAALDENV